MDEHGGLEVRRAGHGKAEMTAADDMDIHEHMRSCRHPEGRYGALLS
jgi:hypothetical protein